MAKLAKKGKAAKESGNIVVDLGEEIGTNIDKRIDRKLTAAGVDLTKKEQMSGPGEGRFGGYKPGGYRPGMFGHRPWYADKRPGMGYADSYASRWRGLLHPHVGKMTVGGLIGALGNVALMRVTPEVVKTDIGLVHSGLAFVVGLIPVIARPNSYTLGAAVPGAAVLAVSLFNYALDSVGIKKPALRGSDPVPGASIQSSIDSRSKLQQVHSRMANPGGVARVQATPVPA
jgi:hypothetical protein